MDLSSAAPEVEPEEFSLPLFVLTVLATLVGLLAALRLFAPGVWAEQFVAPVWKGAIAFLVISLVNCFVEYFFPFSLQRAKFFFPQGEGRFLPVRNLFARVRLQVGGP